MKELCTKPSLLENLKEEGVLNKSFNTREVLIDGSSDEGTFQMTIAGNHLMSWMGSVKLTKKWGATKDDPMPVYICVPEAVYGKWKVKERPPPFKKPLVSKNKPPVCKKQKYMMMAKMDFFVVSIPMGKDIFSELLSRHDETIAGS
jgi:hypothetical protein